MSTIVGIDPGKAGAMAKLVALGGHYTHVKDLPYIDDTPDVESIIDFIVHGDPGDIIVLERQQAMPKQGVSTTFQTGLGYGALLAACYMSGVRVHIVSAAVWKRKMGLAGKDKEASRALAIRLFPAVAQELKRKKDEGRAEALLLAEYGKTLL